MNRWMRIRLAMVFVAVAVGFMLIGLRLAQLQVLPNLALARLAERQRPNAKHHPSYRLPISDRNGAVLALSVPAASLYARPRLVEHPLRSAWILSTVLGGSSRDWLPKLKSDRPFVWLRRQMDEPQVARLQKLMSRFHTRGLFFESEWKRAYPNGRLAGPLLGFTDIDETGIAGLELTFNGALLRSLPERGEGDTRGLSLTLDLAVQHAVEEEVSRAQRETGAASVLAVVEKPTTGEIYAMAQAPGFDPNRPARFSDRLYTSRLIAYLYEPGSTFKPLLVAKALQEKVLSAASMINTENGEYRIGGQIIHEAESTHRYPSLSVAQVVELSSNVGAAKIAQALGAARVARAIEDFHLSSRLELGLPGEVVWAPKKWSGWQPFQLATAGFGQAVAFTPLQMVSAYTVFANHGLWVAPELILADDQTARRPVRVLRPEVADSVRDMLIAVTESSHGTGKTARVPGVQVAGKTGTAQKYADAGGYAAHRYFSSFIEFLPAKQPQLLVGVMLDNPQRKYYSAEVAAPLFRRIAERAMALVGCCESRVAMRP